MKARPIPFALILGSAFLPVSCSEEKIRTYRVASEEAEEAPSPPAEAPKVTSPARTLRWKAPETWKEEAAGQFQTALYRLAPEVTVSVSSLPGDAGGVPANVNRWRQQVGLDPATDLGGTTLASEGEETQSQFFELLGEEKSILAAIIGLEKETWFFKLNAPTSEVDAAREDFISFLKSVEMGSPAEAPRSAAGPQSGLPKISLDVPEGWVKSEGSSMRVASFRIPGTDGVDGDVSVIPLFGEAGSMLENVNRWRAQLRLPALESEDDPALGKILDTPHGKATLIHMASDEALFENERKGAISVAVLKSGGHTWFFKIVGEADLVEQNRDKFEALVSSARLP